MDVLVSAIVPYLLYITPCIIGALVGYWVYGWGGVRDQLVCSPVALLSWQAALCVYRQRGCDGNAELGFVFGSYFAMILACTVGWISPGIHFSSHESGPRLFIGFLCLLPWLIALTAAPKLEEEEPQVAEVVKEEKKGI